MRSIPRTDKSDTQPHDTPGDDIPPLLSPPVSLKFGSRQWRRTIDFFKTGVHSFLQHLRRKPARVDRAKQMAEMEAGRGGRKLSRSEQRKERKNRKAAGREEKNRAVLDKRENPSKERARDEARKGPTLRSCGTLRDRHLEAAKREDEQLMEGMEGAKKRKESGRSGGSARPGMGQRDARSGDSSGSRSGLRKQLTPTD